MRAARAADLMEELRAVVGARMPVAGAASRLAVHDAALAPVVSGGTVVGIVTRTAAEHAARMGAAGVEVAAILCGGAPVVGRRAGPVSMKRRLADTAPGLIVTGRGSRFVAGLIPRDRVALLPDGAVSGGTSLKSRILALTEGPVVDVMKKAAGLAGRRGVRLHLAGGVVRDLLMGRPPRDLDLVVEGDGVAFATALAAELGGALTSHERFGTAVIRLEAPAAGLAGGLRLDVATARRESYAHPAALPAVAPGTIVDDIHRRDVTINGMMIRLDGRGFGTLVDQTGGARDLRHRALQVHHGMSLVDDPTRIFRIARFAARFGFKPTGDTRRSLELARRLGAFERLGGERLWREVSLMAGEPKPWEVWRLCVSWGLPADIGPALRWRPAVRRRMTRFFQGIERGVIGTLQPGIERAWLMLLLLVDGSTRAQRKALAIRLKMTGRRAARLERLPTEAGTLAGRLARGPGAGRVARLCEMAEPETLVLVWSMGGAPARSVEWWLRELRFVRPSLTGTALREMGLPPGPAYAKLLARIRRALLAGTIRTAEEERALAVRLLRNSHRLR